MAEIAASDLDDDHWATSEGVRDHVELKKKGSPVDVESWITTATDSVQAWWKQATDGDVPEDLPETDNQDPNQFQRDHPLLERATELLAASEAHESKAQNIRSDDDGDDKVAHLEHRAKKKFDDWVTLNGYGETDTVQEQGSSLPSAGKTSSLIDLGD